MRGWTGGYEKKDKSGERPEADAPTSARYTCVIGHMFNTPQCRILREGVQVGIISAKTQEEAEWIAGRIAGSFDLPKKYD